MLLGEFCHDNMCKNVSQRFNLSLTFGSAIPLQTPVNPIIIVKNNTHGRIDKRNRSGILKAE